MIQADGVDAGWAVVNTMPREVRLVEIGVLAERRGWGVGTAMLDENPGRGGQRGKTGSIKRERNESRRDPALRTSGIPQDRAGRGSISYGMRLIRSCAPVPVARFHPACRGFTRRLRKFAPLDEIRWQLMPQRTKPKP